MSDIPYSVRDKSTRVNAIKGFNFDSIDNDELFKKQDSNNITGTKIYSTGTNTSKTLKLFTDDPPIATQVGYISGEIDGTLEKLRLNTADDTVRGITITSQGRVGINVVDPEEDLEVDGNIQLDSGGTQRGRIVFYDKLDDHEHAEIEGYGEGFGGGLIFHTKIDGGGVTEKLRINNDGAIGIGGTNYGTTGQVLTSNGDTNLPSWNTIDNLNSLNVNGDMTVGTTDGGYISWLRGVGYSNRISIRGNYLGSDRYILEFRVRGFPNAPAMYLRRDGNSNAYLRVNGSASFGSDNRLKHNEVNLVNALDIINKLQPKVYDKTSYFLDEDYNGELEEGTYNKEVGFIAQEVYEIDELKEYVDVGDETDPWGVNYNALFSYNVGATQELHKLVQAQQTEITLLKSKLNELLSEAGKDTI